MRKLLVLSLSLLSVVALAGCAYEYDAAGKLYPPDSACSDVADCLNLGTTTLQTCLDEIPAGADYFADVWGCLQASACLNADTTSAQFQGFLSECFGDVSLAHPFDALFIDGAMDTLGSCIDGAKSKQTLLIDVCATE